MNNFGGPPPHFQQGGNQQNPNNSPFNQQFPQNFPQQHGVPNNFLHHQFTQGLAQPQQFQYGSPPLQHFMQPPPQHVQQHPLLQQIQQQNNIPQQFHPQPQQIQPQFPQQYPQQNNQPKQQIQQRVEKQNSPGPQQQTRYQPQSQPQRRDHRDHDNYDASFYFPGAASLSDQLDKQVLVVLRDGKKLIGTLRSYDQFANMVLESTVERIVVGNQYSDLTLGLYMVRGENVILMGEIDETLKKSQKLQKISLTDILELQKEEREEYEEKTKKQNLILRRKGLAVDEDPML
ncbi:U6 snRNA-associated Sm-like protein [Acrasis kona]|uniref:U6 snRNA-associated Sm-like protein LSm1 n=1 Tax=Acrasis kona TaxID=1008807 RepID=A0AAW2ZBC1_9EUKA